jgi:hypothetical protein
MSVIIDLGQVYGDCQTTSDVLVCRRLDTCRGNLGLAGAA